MTEWFRKKILLFYSGGVIIRLSQSPRILTGDRPTGPLHLGHYVGTIENRIKLQNQFDCFYLIADLHMLTTKN